MRARPLLFGSIVMGIGAVSLMAACRTPTQVTVVVTYRGPDACKTVPAIALAVRLLPEDAESDVAAHVYTAQTATCTPDGEIGHFGTLVVVPADGEHRASIAIVGAIAPKLITDCTEANHYAGCIVARRVMTFTDHTKLELPVSLDIDCADVPCNAFSTCKQKACVDSTTTCADDTCGLPGEVPGTEAGPPVDGAVPDATPVGDGASDGAITDAASDAADASGLDGGTCGRGRPLLCPGLNAGSPGVDGGKCDFCCFSAGWKCNGLCPFAGPGLPLEMPIDDGHFKCFADDNCPGAEVCCGDATYSACRDACIVPAKHYCNDDCQCGSTELCVNHTNDLRWCESNK